MIDLERIINLIPDSFLDGKSATANLYRIIQVFVEEFNKDITVANSIEALLDINNAAGLNLDRYGTDVGLTRDGRTDEQYRPIIFARVSNLIVGNDVDSISRFLAFFVDADDVEFNQGFDLALENARPRFFDVEVGKDVAQSLIDSLTTALNDLKAAGVGFTINQLEERFMLQQDDFLVLQQDDDRILL